MCFICLFVVLVDKFVSMCFYMFVLIIDLLVCVYMFLDWLRACLVECVLY